MSAKRTGLSIASFICGLLALVLFPFGAAAVVLGFLALRKVRKAPEESGGQGLAWVGIVLGVVLGLVNLLLAAMVIPGNLNAPSRAPQQRTMTDVRTIATGWETYWTDFSTYCPKGREFPAFAWGNISAAELKGILSPDYVKELPDKDGWGHPFQFGVFCPDVGEPVYWIRSAGKDGKWDGDTYAPGTATQRYDADIVYSNGGFVQYPEGPQK
jgi:hypothetical protein